jgi:4-amino-4-deoxy-L-arabinose transferase-like glycosyltransferase
MNSLPQSTLRIIPSKTGLINNCFTGGIIIFSFLWGLWASPLFDEDEGAFAEATREMLESGNYLTTYLNGVLRFDKPILTYWLQALSVSAFGLTEFAVRLPSALAAIAWMYGIYSFARRQFSEPVAQTTVIMAACSLQITIIGKAATADALLNGFLALAMLSLYEVLTTQRTRSVYVFYLATALGWLTKGPVALLIPGAVGVLYALRWHERARFGLLLNGLAIGLFLVVALPWYVLEYLEQGTAFFNGFFVHHNLNRFQTSFEGHAGSLIYYIPVGLIGLMPFTPIILRALRERKQLWSSHRSFYLLVWFGFVWLFFSLSGTKLPHYLIYGYTPLFLLTADYLHTRSESTGLRESVGWLLALLSLLLYVPLLALAAIPYINDPFAVAIIRSTPASFGWDYFWQMVLLMAGVCGLTIPPLSVQQRVAGLGVMMLVLVNGIWMPRLGRLLQQPVVEAAAIARQQVGPVVMYDHYWPSFLFYTRRFVERRPPKANELVLTKITSLATLPPGQIMYSRNGVVLVQLPAYQAQKQDLVNNGP